MRDFYIYGRCVYGDKKVKRIWYFRSLGPSIKCIYAIEVYKHFGFSQIQEEQITDGIRYTPMLFTK